MSPASLVRRVLVGTALTLVLTVAILQRTSNNNAAVTNPSGGSSSVPATGTSSAGTVTPGGPATNENTAPTNPDSGGSSLPAANPAPGRLGVFPGGAVPPRTTSPATNHNTAGGTQSSQGTSTNGSCTTASGLTPAQVANLIQTGQILFDVAPGGNGFLVWNNTSYDIPVTQAMFQIGVGGAQTLSSTQTTTIPAGAQGMNLSLSPPSGTPGCNAHQNDLAYGNCSGVSAGGSLADFNTAVDWQNTGMSGYVSGSNAMCGASSSGNSSSCTPPELDTCSIPFHSCNNSCAQAQGTAQAQIIPVSCYDSCFGAMMQCELGVCQTPTSSAASSTANSVPIDNFGPSSGNFSSATSSNAASSASSHSSAHSSTAGSSGSAGSASSAAPPPTGSIVCPDYSICSANSGSPNYIAFPMLHGPQYRNYNQYFCPFGTRWQTVLGATCSTGGGSYSGTCGACTTPSPLQCGLTHTLSFDPASPYSYSAPPTDFSPYNLLPPLRSRYRDGTLDPDFAPFIGRQGLTFRASCTLSGQSFLDSGGPGGSQHCAVIGEGSTTLLFPPGSGTIDNLSATMNVVDPVSGSPTTATSLNFILSYVGPSFVGLNVTTVIHATGPNYDSTVTIHSNGTVTQVTTKFGVQSTHPYTFTGHDVSVGFDSPVSTLSITHSGNGFTLHNFSYQLSCNGSSSSSSAHSSSGFSSSSTSSRGASSSAHSSFSSNSSHGTACSPTQCLFASCPTGATCQMQNSGIGPCLAQCIDIYGNPSSAGSITYALPGPNEMPVPPPSSPSSVPTGIPNFPSSVAPPVIVSSSSSSAGLPPGIVTVSNPRCGDGIVEEGEQCDDGDICSSSDPTSCNRAPGTGGRCACDPNNRDCPRPAGTVWEQGCITALCGDGVVNNSFDVEGRITDFQGITEQCDNGADNGKPGNPCSATCQITLSPYCGNSIKNPGEQCDDGPQNSDTLSDHCRANCSNPRCGDGIIDSGEQCDDGNLANGDGCSSLCVTETGLPPSITANIIDLPLLPVPGSSLSETTVNGDITQIATSHAAAGKEGPGAILAIAAGAAAGFAFMRRRRMKLS